jgi:hypothetical protein
MISSAAVSFPRRLGNDQQGSLDMPLSLPQYHFRLRQRQTLLFLIILVFIIFCALSFPLIKEIHWMEQMAVHSKIKIPSLPQSTKNTNTSRIMIAVVAYDLNQFHCFDVMYDSFRDMCESGLTVDLFIYTTVDWPQDMLKSLESRMACRHSLAQFHVSIIFKNPDVGVDLVRFHKALFYDNIDNYDLFIYTEDDHHVLLRHVTAYFEETNRLKQILGMTRFTDYSIGFVRYEPNPLENFAHTTFEHQWNFEDFTEFHLVSVGGITNTTYFTPGAPFHQGMYGNTGTISSME